MSGHVHPTLSLRSRLGSIFICVDFKLIFLTLLHLVVVVFRMNNDVKKCFRRELVCLGLERKPLCVCVCVNT